MNLSRSCASHNSCSKAFLEPSECPSWDGAAAGGVQEGPPESPSILCCLEGLLIRIALKKPGKTSFAPRRSWLRVGDHSPQLHSSHSLCPDWKGLALHWKTEFKGTGIDCWAGFWASSLAGWTEWFPSSPGHAGHCLSPQSTPRKEQLNKIFGV